MEQIKNKEKSKIQKVASTLADVVERDDVIHVFGTGGHSVMGAMEIFFRAGGLAPINAIFPPGVSVTESHPNTERLPGYAEKILEEYGVEEDDVIIVSNVNGINSLTIDSALEAQNKGAKVIAVTSPEFANNVPDGLDARHPSNKNLHELGDIVLDVHVPVGDAILELEDFGQKVASSSTIAICFLVNAVTAYTVKELLERGIEPPVWKSANVEGGDEANKEYIEKYHDKIHHLYRM